MKPLLSKTTKPFLFYLFVILVISVPAYYFMIKKIWVSELDEHNRILAKTTEEQLMNTALSDVELKEKIDFWNKIQPGVYIAQDSTRKYAKDSVFTATSESLSLAHKTDDSFRVLITTIHINGKPHYFRSITNYEDTKETVFAIAIVTFFFIVCIVLGLFLINRYLASTIWKPFRNTLDKLKTFNLNKQLEIEFEETDTIEFEELNQSLKKLIEQNISVYKTQKEFTENASHELQTPLAILKNKLDLFLQSDDLTEKQYNIAEEMNKALVRSSRINKNLLLLTKIENNQFDTSETVYFDALLNQSLDIIQEYFEQKNLHVSTDIVAQLSVTGNASLMEVLIHNLLLNAIRHSRQGDLIQILLTKRGLEIANSGEQPLNSELLFKRFSRMTADTNGSGLGLSIVQQICRYHNWEVTYRFENNFHIFSINMSSVVN